MPKASTGPDRAWVHVMKDLLSKSNRAKRVAKANSIGGYALTVTAHPPPLSRRAVSIGVIAPLLLLGLASCGEKKPILTNPPISQTIVLRGVLTPTFPLPTPGVQYGTISPLKV